ncbi:MAG: hypothetical protein ACXVJD_17220 [Mucilaginibacter sp.]
MKKRPVRYPADGVFFWALPVIEAAALSVYTPLALGTGRYSLPSLTQHLALFV